MTVFVLLGRNRHEGPVLLGVYQSRTDAEIAYVVYCQDREAFDKHEVTEVELGAAAEFRL